MTPERNSHFLRKSFPLAETGRVRPNDARDSHLDQFMRWEEPFWQELKHELRRLMKSVTRQGLATVQRFHYLYERTCSDLAKVQRLSADPELWPNRERLVVGQAYARLHSPCGSHVRDDLATLAVMPV